MESEGNSTIQVLGVSMATSTAGFYTHIFDGTPALTDGYGSVTITCNSTREGSLNAMHSIDNSIWDITDAFGYPGSDVSVGGTLFTTKPLKARWYKTQYINPSEDFSCSIRLQTIFQPYKAS